MPLKRLIQQARRVLRTLPGRLFVLSTVLLVALTLLTALAPASALPPIVDIFRKVVRLALFVSLAWLGWQAVRQGRREWLWAVRRKLILSYVFFGVFPVALIAVFVFVAALVLYMNTATYLFQTGYQTVVDEVALVAETAVAEIGQSAATAADVLAHKYDGRRNIQPALSMAALTRQADGSFLRVIAGPWRHLPAPATVPAWLVDRPGGFKGSLALRTERTADERLVIRVVRASADHRTFVIVDLPVDSDLLARIHDATGARIEAVTITSSAEMGRPLIGSEADDGVSDASSGGGLFTHTVAFLDFIDWQQGIPGRASIRLDAPVRQIYDRMTTSDSGGVTSALRQMPIVPLLVAIAGLFVIIQISAFVGGVALARRITSAVHSLFVGTAKIGQGDFSHRIPIGSNDQLGDLAGSFNNMSASIEHLRHIERDKLRLDEELQIARRIQRSLLPAHVPSVPGLCISDLCEPAMEVGGDYYDFFPLGPRQLGVLVADVSGKGTSAALYMAELKGLMLALSRTHRSPRALLIELNGLLAEHLDNRSFISMTYAVIDLEARTLTCARAGHTPLLVVRGDDSRVIVPEGMVLGLSLPGAAVRFGQLLQEYTQPLLPGDVVVLYTDGITEAMNPDGDLFGDTNLARVVTAHRALDSAGIRERVVRDVRAFAGAAEPHDDMTMVVLKLKDDA